MPPSDAAVGWQLLLHHPVILTSPIKPRVRKELCRSTEKQKNLQINDLQAPL
jgi:hypothetical protein